MAGQYNVPGTSGVYEIKNLVSGKRYVGSSVNVEARWKRHIYELELGIHHNTPLQRAWVKYGPQAFSHNILETCDDDTLRQTEQRYLDEEKPEYNTSTLASGAGHSEETLAKISQACRKAWSDPERRAKLSEIGKARGRPAAALDGVRKLWDDADRRQELLERRAKPVYEAFGGMWTLKDLATTYDVEYGMLKDRLRAGWPLEHAVVTPKRPGGL